MDFKALTRTRRRAIQSYATMTTAIVGYKHTGEHNNFGCKVTAIHVHIAGQHLGAARFGV